MASTEQHTPSPESVFGTLRQERLRVVCLDDYALGRALQRGAWT